MRVRRTSHAFLELILEFEFDFEMIMSSIIISAGPLTCEGKKLILVTPATKRLPECMNVKIWPHAR